MMSSMLKPVLRCGGAAGAGAGAGTAAAAAVEELGAGADTDEELVDLAGWFGGIGGFVRFTRLMGCWGGWLADGCGGERRDGEAGRVVGGDIMGMDSCGESGGGLCCWSSGGFMRGR